MSFEFERETTPHLAEALLGYQLSFQGVSGIIVETEAYLGTIDAAAHAYGGRKTLRLQALYQAGGTIYVYQMRQYFMLNLVTQRAGLPECILVRAVQPQTGITQMQARRHQTDPFALASGPGKLCQAFAITKTLNGKQVNEPNSLTLSSERLLTPAQISHSPRIGIPNKGQWTEAALRFYVAGNPYVSLIKRAEIETKKEGWS